MKRTKACFSDSHPHSKVGAISYSAIALSSQENRKEENNPTISTTITTTLESLPVEVLVRIVLALPWRDRVRIEAVSSFWRELALTRGWTDVYHFDELHSEFWEEKVRKRELHGKKIPEEGVDEHTVWRQPLLARMGSRLISIETSPRFYLPNACELLRADLEECPNLKHLSLGPMRMDAAVLEYIGRRYPTLKSLSLARCSPIAYIGEAAAKEVYWSALNGLLGSLSSLEYLRIEEDDMILLMRLSLNSFNELRHISLCFPHDSEHGSVETKNNLATLASLPSLSSLALDDSYFDAVDDFSFLGNLSRLEHLGLWLCTSNLESFTKVMPHLNTRLRALEVNMWISRENGTLIDFVEPVVAAIATHLRKLEHLSIMDEWNEVEEDNPDTEQMNRWLQPLSTLQLRSLTLDCCEELSTVRDWRWLEGMPPLEYLSVAGSLPLGIATALVRNHKKLGCLYAHRLHNPRAEEKAALVEAADARVAAIKEAGVGQTCAENLFPIFVGVRPLFAPRLLPRTRQTTPAAGFGVEEESKVDAEFRKRFIEEWRESFLLYRYKYGCLSEGEPPFTRH